MELDHNLRLEGPPSALGSCTKHACAQPTQHSSRIVPAGAAHREPRGRADPGQAGRRWPPLPHLPRQLTERHQHRRDPAPTTLVATEHHGSEATWGGALEGAGARSEAPVFLTERTLAAGGREAGWAGSRGRGRPRPPRHPPRPRLQALDSVPSWVLWRLCRPSSVVLAWELQGLGSPWR